MNKHPHLSALFELYSKENQPFRKVHRMIDLFESIIKTHTAVILSEYVRYNKLSDSAKGLLAQGLKIPSLGTWQLFSRVLFQELQKEEFSWTFNHFASEFAGLDKALNAQKTNVIAMRNGYAHGATPSDEHCEVDIRKFEPFLLKLMELKWLTSTSIRIDNGIVFITDNLGESLSLHPILLHRNENCDASFAFFNDLKNDKVGLLNYPLGKHYKEKEFYSEFLKILPLNEWKSSGSNEFHQRIDELTETFKGRTTEREKLLQFASSKKKGYLSIQGNPGIGKSALIAQFFRDLKHHKISKSLRIVEYFIRRGTPQAQVHVMLAYLIRRTDEYFPAGKGIRAKGETTFDIQNQLFEKWRLWSEQSDGKKFLFLIDGLDEGAENNILEYLPRENFENILFIYGSRPGGHKSIDELWATLPTEHHQKMELKGLGKKDIRALVYEVANKYEIERESTWIDTVQIKSQGNPLYLKLLCDSIEHGGVVVNDVQSLPDKIDEYYKAILNRYSKDEINGDALLYALFTFAAAQDFLTTSHIGQINNFGPAETRRVCATLKEVLYENPLTERVFDFQLFHESFREYLLLEFPKEIQNAAYRIINFCSNWNELEDSWEQRYALEHFAFHLSSSGKVKHHEYLFGLITNLDFIEMQKKVLKNFEPSKKLFRTALIKAIALKKEELALESALRLIDLKYEEANEAPQVVALVNSEIPGDIELALKRIENFGGVDEDGLRRKFMLYVLCLMELTLLEGRDNAIRKTLIEQLLNHLDEQLPTDHSILDWSKFCSNHTIFLIACECAALGLSIIAVIKRTSSFDVGSILEHGLDSKFQLSVLLESVLQIAYTPAMERLSIYCAKQGQLETSLAMARAINDARKYEALLNISSELTKQGKVNVADSVMKEALETARGYRNDENSFHVKCKALATISSELFILGEIDKAASVMQEAFEIVGGYVENNDYKCEALASISNELLKQGKQDEAASVMHQAVTIAHATNGYAIVVISSQLVKQGNHEAAIEMTRSLDDIRYQDMALGNISSILAEQGLFEAALKTARKINDDYDKSRALLKISIELAKQQQHNTASLTIQEALEIASRLRDEISKNSMLEDISKELAKRGQFESALATAHRIKNPNAPSKLRTLSIISNEFIKLGRYESAKSIIQNSTKIFKYLDEQVYVRILNEIASELIRQGQLNAVIETAHNFESEHSKNIALAAISSKLAEQRLFDEALETVLKISDEYYNCLGFIAISSELIKQEKEDEATTVIQNVLETAYSIDDDFTKDRVLSTISCEQAVQGHMDAAIETTLGIGGEIELVKSLCNISNKLNEHGDVESALSVLQKVFSTIQNMTSNRNKDNALYHLCIQFVEQGRLELALETATAINQEFTKSSALSHISSEFAKKNRREAVLILKEALLAGSQIQDEYVRSNVISKISDNYAKKGLLEKALEIAHKIEIDSDWKAHAFSTISYEYAKLGNLRRAESLVLCMNISSMRHSAWKELAAQYYAKNGFLDALKGIHRLRSEEARLFYLRGLTNSLNILEATSNTLVSGLPVIINDTESIEELLQKYAINKLFFGKMDVASQSRLNNTLDIQWAIDIKNRFSTQEEFGRSSTNLDTWLHDIDDEDDRDQIELWARKVSKGRMTEEEFRNNVENL